jgi:hypothetical protein
MHAWMNRGSDLDTDIFRMIRPHIVEFASEIGGEAPLFHGPRRRSLN